MRPVLLALTFVLPLLAGCASPGQDATQGTAAPAAPAAVPLVWDLGDCEAMTWQILVPASRMADRMPSGFAPAGAAEAPVAMPDGIEQAGTLAFEAVECGTGFDVDVLAARSVPAGRVFTPVIPPREQADGRTGTAHAYTWAALVTDAAWHNRLAAFGLPVHDGGTQVGPCAQGWCADLALDNVGAFSFVGRSPNDRSPGADQPFRDFTAATDGIAAWVGTRTDVRAASGLGVWTASPESWVAQLVGTTTGVATYTLATWNIPHEAITRPAGDGTPFMGPRDE